VNRVFIDTSAVLALLNPDDAHHDRARRSFETLRSKEVPLVTTSYVLVETYALLSRRMGLEAVQAFRTTMAPLIEVVWVDEEVHESGLDLLLERNQRRLSLVDVVSFLTIHENRIERVFAFDRHFDQEGFARVSEV
jgi:predicted nucleic acid-binding protein